MKIDQVKIDSHINALDDLSNIISDFCNIQSRVSYCMNRCEDLVKNTDDDPDMKIYNHVMLCVQRLQLLQFDLMCSLADINVENKRSNR